MGKQAFNGPRGQHFYADPERVSVIGLAGKEGSGPLDTSHGKGEHPLWDERVDIPVDVALAKNIKAYGVMESVKVRKNGKYPPGHPLEGEDIIEVIEGRQRTRSCRLAAKMAANDGTVAPLLKIEFQKTDEEGLFGIMISANEQRRDDLPSVKARKAARILAQGHPPAAVANMFGVTTTTVDRWTKFVELDKKVQSAVDQGKVSFTAATQLHGLSQEEQVTKLEELIAEGNTTVEAVRRATPRSNGGARTPALLTKSKAKKLVGNEDFMEALDPDGRAILRLVVGDGAALDEVEWMKKYFGV